jgi:hypothetical protein
VDVVLAPTVVGPIMVYWPTAPVPASSLHSTASGRVEVVAGPSAPSSVDYLLATLVLHRPCNVATIGQSDRDVVCATGCVAAGGRPIRCHTTRAQAQVALAAKFLFVYVTTVVGPNMVYWPTALVPADLLQPAAPGRVEVFAGPWAPVFDDKVEGVCLSDGELTQRLHG